MLDHYTLSLDKKIPFKLSDFSVLIDVPSNYCFGFLVATSAAGFIDFNYINDIFTIESMNNEISLRVRDKLISRTNEETNPVWKANWLGLVSKIESYFTKT